LEKQGEKSENAGGMWTFEGASKMQHHFINTFQAGKQGEKVASIWSLLVACSALLPYIHTHFIRLSHPTIGFFHF